VSKVINYQVHTLACDLEVLNTVMFYPEREFVNSDGIHFSLVILWPPLIELLLLLLLLLFSLVTAALLPDLSSTLPSGGSSRAPSLGLVLYLLKTSAADFSRFHQSHRQSLSKLQALDQLPPEELKEVRAGSLCLSHCLSHVSAFSCFHRSGVSVGPSHRPPEAKWKCSLLLFDHKLQRYSLIKIDCLLLSIPESSF